MPTETYFNLNEEKQKRVYRAVFQEYTRVPLEEVSVKNIVNSADIPRGSFYQYFTDKEEALVYLISETRNQSHGELEHITSELQLNIYELMEALFMDEINKLKNKEESARLLLLKQIIKSAKATSIFYNVMTNVILEHPMLEACWNNISSIIDKKDLRKSIIDLLFATLNDCLIVAIEDENKIDVSINTFKLKIEIIQLGVNNLVKKNEMTKDK
ncbi:TetR/AcrR family transcriptional regulator [Alkaliphilus serpentinus]|uniref:TetR/AcrR family transcriptional regulator n=1 Tax=Alkaliphilus serpentinus TaxID=1482731 RepID=A0A833HRM9_9FIRM|nr:TetR/AcrR family transcriptional regulator [Alkaliphilus serpentinus]KAB3532169.1 TetR/AcrR family transcriptional regulator [Alkaliphilus serpentinus]